MLDYGDESVRKQLNRNPDVIQKQLVQTDDFRVVCKSPIEVMFPEHYLNKSLCEINEEIYCLGIFAVLHPGTSSYAVFSIPAKVVMPIGETRTITVDDVKYRVVRYEAGDTFIANTRVMQDEQLAYWIFDYYIALANVPWYMNYMDIVKLFDQDGYYMGGYLPPNSQIVDMLSGNIARNSNNGKMMYRVGIKHLDDVWKTMPQWVPLKNISLGSVDTYSKIMGSYFDDGVTSALVAESQTATPIEQVLRS